MKHFDDLWNGIVLAAAGNVMLFHHAAPLWGRIVGSITVLGAGVYFTLWWLEERS